jgi:hypothetical protein
VSLTDDARKRVLVAWQERKRDELRHPFLNETIPLGLLAHVQAQARPHRGHFPTRILDEESLGAGTSVCGEAQT